MVKPAQASGTVPVLMNDFCFALGDNEPSYLAYSNASKEACFAAGAAYITSRPKVSNVSCHEHEYRVNGYSFAYGCTYTVTDHYWWRPSEGCISQSFNDVAYGGTAKACPPNSYSPNIPVSYATTCTCYPGYALDPAGTSCIQPPLTISLTGLGGEVLPTKTRTAYAKVTTSNGLPKSGAQVSLALTVVPELQGQLPVTYTGTLSTQAGTTGSDGRLSFEFRAPTAGGTHTITASCTGCTNNPVTGTIKVPGCPVKELTPIADLSTQSGETAEQTDLTKKLEDGMNGYSLLSAATQAAEQCLAGRINTVVGPPSTSGYKVTSTIRTPAYQKHLREVWDKFIELQSKVDDDPSIQQSCQTLITKVEGEMGFSLSQDPADKADKCNPALGRAHCVRYPPAKADPKHIAKTAFDIPLPTVEAFTRRLKRPPPSTVQQEANTCGLKWGGTFSSPDRIHFLLQ